MARDIPSWPRQLFQNIGARHWSYEAGQIAVFPGLSHASGEDRRKDQLLGAGCMHSGILGVGSTRHAPLLTI